MKTSAPWLRNTLTVTKSNFQSLKHGVLSYDRTPSITNNLFADCKEAIYQASHGNNNGIPIDISMTLTCNRFERGNTFSGTKYGLWVDDNVPMENIGGPGTTSDPTLPNANVFPTAGSRPATRYDQNSPGAWVAPSDFVAVRFGTLATQYFAFANEFVGNYEPLQSSVQALATLDCFTAADPLAIPGPNRVEVCPSLGSSVVYFPLRIAPLTSLGSDVVREFRLYPNPVSQLLVLEHGADFVASVPVVADLTGKVLDVRWSRTDKGYQADMSSFAAGVYYVKVGHKSNKIIKQ